MRRVAAAALLAVGFALATSGCGVQSTGVNVAQTAPYSTSQANSSMSASPSTQLYQVQLFLYLTSNGSLREVTRPVDIPPRSGPAGALDLAYQLREMTPQEHEDAYSSWVPPDLTLEPTSNAHEYRVTSSSYVSPAALYQLVCTLDQYWQQNKDGHNASTQFLYPGNYANGWQDCNYLLPAATPTKITSKPSVPNTSRIVPSGN